MLGLNVQGGHVTYAAVAEAFDMPFVPASQVVQA
jgi:alanine dehydrogenase